MALLRFGYITRLRLKDIRAIESLDLDLMENDQPRMLSVITGRNGTCKSTLLRCIALALCNADDTSALLVQPEARLISERTGFGRISIDIAEGKNILTIQVDLKAGQRGDRDIVADRQIMSGHKSASEVYEETEFFVCGYGAGRGQKGDPKTRAPQFRVVDAVNGLFDYSQGFQEIELTLRRLEDFLGTSKYENTLRGIKRVLGLGPDHTIEYARGGGVRISGPGTGNNVPLESWADGYRMTFNWIIDLYSRAMQAEAVTQTGGIRGILLIDEIEQHLHPAMQRDLITDLREVLPEMQIFATTHSPLVALSTESENLIALHRTEEGITSAQVPSLAGYSSDDVLVEESLFGTDPYPRQTRAKLERYRQIKATPAAQRSKRQVAELKTLAADLSPSQLPAQRDDPIAARLDEIIQLLNKEEKQ